MQAQHEHFFSQVEVTGVDSYYAYSLCNYLV